MKKLVEKSETLIVISIIALAIFIILVGFLITDGSLKSSVVVPLLIVVIVFISLLISFDDLKTKIRNHLNERDLNFDKELKERLRIQNEIVAYKNKLEHEINLKRRLLEDSESMEKDFLKLEKEHREVVDLIENFVNKTKSRPNKTFMGIFGEYLESKDLK